MSVRIFDLANDNLVDFHEYLKKYFPEKKCNNVHYFQSLLSKQQKYTENRWDSLQYGSFNKFGGNGWRKIWVVGNPEGKIIGHIGIHSQEPSSILHRSLLEMWILSGYQRLKLQQNLKEIIFDYCKDVDDINQINLEVVKNNTTTISLHKKTGYEGYYVVKDLFRIQGATYDSLFMSLNLN